MERNDIINSVSPRHQCQEQEQEARVRYIPKTSEDLISREEITRPGVSEVENIRQKEWRTG